MTTIKTMDDVRKAAEKSGVSVEVIQKEYGIYEYTFTSCQEALDGYKLGFETSWLSTEKPDRSDPKLIAYRKGWQEISLKECPDVSKLTFEQALAFLKICYKEGDQFVALLTLIEHLMQTDVARQAEFLNKYQYYTFYEKDCPLKALVTRQVKKLEVYYLQRIKNTHGTADLLALKDEIESHKIGEIRPRLDVYEPLWRKIFRSAKTITELFALPDTWKCLRMERWKELHPKATMDELLPHLIEPLAEVRQADKESYNDYNDLWFQLEHFYSRCTTLDHARAMLEIGRAFCCYVEGFWSMKTDPTFKLFREAHHRILRSMYPHPKLSQFRQLHEKTCMKSDYRAEVERRWKDASLKALERPIPNFALLYDQVHKDVKLQVLRKWNKWGLEQLEGLETYEELLKVDQTFFPSPQGRGYQTYQVWMPADQNPFSTFRIWLQRLTKKAKNMGQMITVQNIILIKRKKQDECATGTTFFGEELMTITKKMLATKPSLYHIQALYETRKAYEPNPKCFISPSRKVIMEALVDKDPAQIDYILSEIDEHNHYRPEFLRKKVELSMVG